jgi:hypothetical protein
MWLWTLTAGVNPADASEEDEGDEGDEDSDKAKKAGYVIEYDAARKMAQGLGAHLESLAGLVEVKGDKARLLPVEERAKRLFGKDASDGSARRRKKESQSDLFDVLGDEGSSAVGVGSTHKPAQTVLDRVHQTMLLFAANRTEALKRFLVEEGVGRDAHFWRLAQALSALYPTISNEKRWIDGVLARKRGLGF